MKKRFISIRFKLIGIIFGIFAILEGISIPISYAIVRDNEINLQNNRMSECMDTLSSVFAETSIGSAIDLDKRAFQKIYPNYKDQVLIPGTPEFDAYLEDYQNTKKQMAPLGMTSIGTYHDILLKNLESLVVPTNSDYLYIGVYDSSNNVFLVSIGAIRNTTLEKTKYANYYVESGYFFDFPYEKDENDTRFKHIDYVDPNKGKLFVTGQEVKYIDDSDEDPIQYLVISETRMEAIEANINSFVLRFILISVISMAILFIGVMIYLDFSLVKKVRRISNSLNDTTEKMKNNEFEVGFKESKARYKDELIVLNNDLFFMESELINYVNNLKEAISNEQKVKAELDLSREIQLTSLPNTIIYNENIGISPLILPAKEVGGDLYDYFNVDENRICVVIGDVSGKGVPAALFMMKAKALIKQEILSKKTLEESLIKINNELSENNDRCLFITAIIGIIDTNSGQMELINCGHDLMFATNTNGFFKPKLNMNIPLGLMKDYEFNKDVHQFKPGNTIFMCTDGVSEAQNSESILFGEEAILSKLNELKDLPNPFINQAILDSVLKYEEGHDQDDDICMLSFTFKPTIMPITNQINEMEKVNELIDKKTSEIKNKDAVSELKIIADELISNVIKHAYKGEDNEIFIEVINTDNSMILKIYDTGEEFNPFDYENPDRKEDDIGGLGIQIVKNIASKFNYKRIQNTNVIEIVKEF